MPGRTDPEMSLNAGPPVSSSGGGASGKATYLTIGICGSAIERQVGVQTRVCVELRAAHADFLRVGQVSAKDPDARVCDLCLKVLDLGDVGREVRRHAAQELGLQPHFDVAHVFGLDAGRRDHRLVGRVSRHAVQIQANRLETGRVSRVDVDRPGDAVGGGDLPRQIRVVDIRLIFLRRQNRPLQRDQRRIAGLQPAVDLLVEVDVLLVVVESKSRKQTQTIGERNFDLAEQGARSYFRISRID